MEAAVLGTNGANGIARPGVDVAARRRAVRIAKALAGNELRPITLADILRARGPRVGGSRTGRRGSGVRRGRTSRGGGGGTRGSSGSRTGSGPGGGGPGSPGGGAAEAAALLALGEGDGLGGADAGAVEGGAAARGAVGVADASAGDELGALAVADVLVTGRILGSGDGEDGDGDCVWGNLVSMGVLGSSLSGVVGANLRVRVAAIAVKRTILKELV